MSRANRTYYISLGDDAYYCKTMAVDAENIAKACEFAMAHADDDVMWEDSLESSPHWIASIDDDFGLVPEEYREMTIRCGGPGPIAHRLHSALSALVQACERNARHISGIRSEIERAKGALAQSSFSD